MEQPLPQQSVSGSRRIGYIDAMRGFTMILVVYSHVCNYCLGDKWMGWNDVFFLFRLPCFFFISGWLFHDVARRPVVATVRHKFMVQIVPTVIFLLLLAPPPLFFSRLGATKGGYWFTFALFEFFLFYMFSERRLRRWGAPVALLVSLLAFCYDVYYNRYFRDMGLLTDVLGFLGLITWRYYLFFFIGTRARRHFDGFLRLVRQPVAMAVAVLVFTLMAALPHGDQALREYLIFALGGISGLTVVFAFFHWAGARMAWRPLQYVGRRTLDIYLLHYFVLPRFLVLYSGPLRASGSRLLEFVVALGLALAVVGVCLAVSYVVRLSPFLGHYLFGVKYEGGRQA